MKILAEPKLLREPELKDQPPVKRRSVVFRPPKDAETQTEGEPPEEPEPPQEVKVLRRMDSRAAFVKARERNDSKYGLASPIFFLPDLENFLTFLNFNFGFMKKIQLPPVIF